MDRNTILAMVLIGALILGYMIYSSTTYDEQNAKQQTEQTTQNDERSTTENTSLESDELFEDTESPQIKSSELEYGEFQKFTRGDRETLTVETELYTAVFSNKGGDLIKWKLKEYDKWNKKPVQLIQDYEGELFITFTSGQGKRIDSRNLYFDFNTDKNLVKLTGDETFSFNAVLEVENGKKIIKKYRLYADKYLVDTDIELVQMDDYIPRGYSYKWTDGIAYQEKNSVDESQNALAIAQLNGEIEELDAADDDKKATLTGKVDYIASKVKYFGVAIMPKDFDGTIDMVGYSKSFPETEGLLKKYDIGLQIPYRGGNESQEFQIYLGPLDMDIIENYGLNRMVDLGWWGIRHIGEYIMMPIFRVVHWIIPNWGLAIIVFSIFIKLVLYPLSVTQMKNAQKMKLLAPVIQESKDKYKDDPQQQQKQMMKVYSEYGVNPASGCLPLLLQMPILYSLWTLFRNSIDLRQSEFILWINDLSTPDYIIHFGTSILGISALSGLALLMGVTMFVQQKLTISDPRQKGLVYIMPVMFTLLFSSFPSGLNLYYFMFNLLGIGQQLYINNFSKEKIKTIDDLKKSAKGKKKGWLATKMEEAQKMAEQQGKMPPGAGGANRKNPSNPNYRKKKNRKKK